MTSNLHRENSPAFEKYVLKRHYELADIYEVETCTECKKKRPCQKFEATDGSKSVWICEQCTWNLSDYMYKKYYEE